MTPILSGHGLVCHAPAKLNLFFEIIGKRPDGYHDVCSLCCPIDVYDTLFFEPRGNSEVTLICDTGDHWQNTQEIPTGPENLVVRAVELVRRRFGIRSGCHLRLVKRIPSQAGMGGGSSDAAAAIRLADAAWNLRLSRQEMVVLGAELGSDVPLFFIDGPSIGYGRGERVEELGGGPVLDFVIVKPPEGISTAEAFRHCGAHSIEKHRTPETLVRGLLAGDRRAIASGLFNRLETTACELNSKVRRIRDIFAKLDCTACQMTGSGTAYFALCRNSRQARQLASRLRLSGVGDVFVARSDRGWSRN